jgi:hypothetical protein
MKTGRFLRIVWAICWALAAFSVVLLLWIGCVLTPDFIPIVFALGAASVGVGGALVWREIAARWHYAHELQHESG